MTEINKYFVMNAAGTCKNLEGLLELCKVDDISAILIGSVTKQKRDGNSGEVYRTFPQGTLNSLGMNNLGFDYYSSRMRDWAQVAHAKGKKFGVSVAGVESIDEYAIMTAECISKNVDFVELNGGCPNVWDNGKQHRILTFDLNACEKLFRAIYNYARGNAEVYFKVSPISDPVYIQELASLINRCSCITGITTTNTFPNGHGRDAEGKQLIAVGKGLAGVSGTALKFISKGQVLQWREYLSPEKQIIAVGGIDCGQDILDYSANGAVKFQIGTAFLNTGASIFGQVLAETEELVENRK